jgi:hypothetical protein
LVRIQDPPLITTPEKTIQANAGSNPAVSAKSWKCGRMEKAFTYEVNIAPPVF